MENHSELEQLKQTQIHQGQQLSASFKLIDKFSAITKGHNTELDNQFGKLRKLISKNTDQDKILANLKAVTANVGLLEKEQLSAFNDFKLALISAASELQKTKGMEDTLRRQLRMLVNKLKSGNVSLLSDLQDIAIQLLAVFNAVKNAEQQSSSHSRRNETANIIKSLLQGLEKLSQNDVVIPRLHSSIERIYSANSEREQLELCLKTFETIIEQFSDEFKQTQKLILNINSALEEVHQVLVKSLKKSKRYDSELQKLNKQIDQQIAELSKDTEEAKSVKQLQSLVNSKIEAITESIKKRDAIEQKRTMELDSSLSVMESKLSQMEERTEFYRAKWLEEKSRSETDSLTSLPNRGSYDARIIEEINRWSRNPAPLTLAVIDIDHFKNINDKYGHSVGDKTLQIVAKTVRKYLRATDYVARYGGEEFVCLMVDTDLKEAQKPLEKIRKAIESIPFTIKNDRVNITISIGYTAYTKKDDEHSLFDRADKALYQAKDTGRNKICYIE